LPVCLPWNISLRTGFSRISTTSHGTILVGILRFEELLILAGFQAKKCHIIVEPRTNPKNL